MPEPEVYDLVLKTVGPTPNDKMIAADKAGVAVTDRDFIIVDTQMRTNVRPLHGCAATKEVMPKGC